MKKKWLIGPSDKQKPALTIQYRLLPLADMLTVAAAMAIHAVTTSQSVPPPPPPHPTGKETHCALVAMQRERRRGGESARNGEGGEKERVQEKQRVGRNRIIHGAIL